MRWFRVGNTSHPSFCPAAGRGMLGAMTKRRRTLGLVAVAAVVGAAAIAVWWPIPPPHGINRDTYAQIHERMTRAEVEALTRVPEGAYMHAAGYSYVGPEDKEWVWLVEEPPNRRGF